MIIVRHHGRAVARATVAAALLGLLASACGGGGNDTPDAMLSPVCLEAQDHSDLAWIQENIFTPNCAAFAACHQGAATQAQGLNLEAGNSEANLVGVASQRFPDQTLVVPGDPQSSYIMTALGSYVGQLSDVGTMPPNSPLICVQKREAIERWIDSL